MYIYLRIYIYKSVYIYIYIDVLRVRWGVEVPPVRDGRCTKSLTEETVHGELWLDITGH
jgi:hypothetical protein